MDAATLQFTVLGWRKRHGRMTELTGQTIENVIDSGASVEREVVA